MRGFGEIRRLCDVARPDVGVVTAVAPSHTERVGGIDGVARAKAELVEALPPSGTAILNADDQRVAAMAAQTAAAVVTFGRAGGADVRIDDLARRRPRPAAVHGAHAVGDRRRSRLAVSGEHMAVNAAAALAVAGVLGVDRRRRRRGPRSGGAVGDADAARADARPAGWSINDAYNANPTSMAAALDALAAVDGGPARRGARADGRARRPGAGPPGDRRPGRASSASS